MDKYQKFAILTLVLSLFLMVVVANGWIERLLPISGIVYSLVFIFHSKIENFVIPKIKRPLLTYGIFVVLNGLFVEVLAYWGNFPSIQRGEIVHLFSVNFYGDLLISLPYYITLAVVFSWCLRKYKLSTFELGAMIWLFWAIFVDTAPSPFPLPFPFVGVHFLQLLQGDILAFIIAGFIMLFTLHTPIVIFENKINETYPERSRSWAKYPAAFALQYLSLVVTTIFVIAKNFLFGM